VGQRYIQTWASLKVDMKSTSFKAISWLFILTLILANVCQKSRPSTPKTNKAGTDLFGDIRAHLEQLVVDDAVPSIAVAVARRGVIIWEEGFGLADREKKIPATENTAYPLASISKTFTATALMILAERGLVDLDAPVNDYLGEAKLRAHVGNAAEATVRRVASHTAGLPLHCQCFYNGEQDQPPPINETIRRYGYLSTAPGERWQYANLGYGILGYIISRVSGREYAEFMQEEVFAPLGMDRTSIHIGPGLEKYQAVKYTSDGMVVPPYDSDSPGADAIYSSAHDLIRFAMFHLKNDLSDQRAILSDASIDGMQRPSPETGPRESWEREGSGYGIGWFIGVTENGLRVVYHTGGTLGVSTILALVPEEELAVAVLSNSDNEWRGLIATQIVCKLLSLPEETFLPSDGQAATAQRFVPPSQLIGLWRGSVYTYEGEVGLMLEIEESGTIYANLAEQPRVPLQNVCYQETLPQFINAGGGPFLRGWMQCDLETADVKRGRPSKLWLELKLRQDVLNGSLVAFSQKELYIGPLSYWVELKKD
jgi:CubicO group peptidase (beta-lactamase class C family)